MHVELIKEPPPETHKSSWCPWKILSMTVNVARMKDGMASKLRSCRILMSAINVMKQSPVARASWKNTK
jgi:hypothetical protein